MPLSRARQSLVRPSSPALRPEPAVAEQVFTAFHRAREHVVGMAVAIKAKQAEYRPGAAAHDVQLLVRGNKLVGEELRR